MVGRSSVDCGGKLGVASTATLVVLQHVFKRADPQTEHKFIDIFYKMTSGHISAFKGSHLLWSIKCLTKPHFVKPTLLLEPLRDIFIWTPRSVMQDWLPSLQPTTHRQNGAKSRKSLQPEKYFHSLESPHLDPTCFPGNRLCRHYRPICSSLEDSHSIGWHRLSDGRTWLGGCYCSFSPGEF